MKRDQIRCLACLVNVEHSAQQHEEYLAVWCSQHQSWCGDHTEKSILGAIRKWRSEKSGSEAELKAA